jgi:hypothetical protein
MRLRADQLQSGNDERELNPDANRSLKEMNESMQLGDKWRSAAAVGRDRRLIRVVGSSPPLPSTLAPAAAAVLFSASVFALAPG